MAWNHGTFGVAYLANSDMPGVMTMLGNLTANFAYESNRNLISNVDNKNASNMTVSKYAYVNNDIGQRTSMEKSGLAFAQTDSISYLYNDRQELTSATAQNETAYNYTYSFDSIGNRATASERGTGSTYTANTLNQYTLINALSPSYDNDGNMLGDGASWTYVWDAENRLKSATNGTKTLEFAYDYMSRRVERKVYVGESLTEHKKYLYDNYKHIETLDAANSNSLLQKYLWGGDRLLAVYDVSNGESYSYFIDANKNIGQLVDASGNIVAKYEYGPFGQITKSEGSYADSNPYRFSSEQWDNDLGLVYYNYRYYSPSLGRWLSRDPIEEKGGNNLYCIVRNNLVDLQDSLGFADPNSPNPLAMLKEWNSLTPSQKNAYEEANRKYSEEQEAIAKRFDSLDCVSKALLTLVNDWQQGNFGMNENVNDIFNRQNPDFSKDWDEYIKKEADYYHKNYSTPNSWNVGGFGIGGDGFNPLIANPSIARDTLFGNETTALATLIHEPQHNPSQRGLGHKDKYGNDWGRKIQESINAARQLAINTKDDGCCDNGSGKKTPIKNKYDRIQCDCGIK